MKPAVHVALIGAAAICVLASLSFIVWAGDEKCGVVGKGDSFQCSHSAETLGLAGFYGSLLVLAVLLTYAAVRLVGWVVRLGRPAE